MQAVNHSPVNSVSWHIQTSKKVLCCCVLQVILHAGMNAYKAHCCSVRMSQPVQSFCGHTAQERWWGVGPEKNNRDQLRSVLLSRDSEGASRHLQQ